MTFGSLVASILIHFH